MNNQPPKYDDICVGMNVKQTRAIISLEGPGGCPSISVDKAWLLRLRDRFTELAEKMVDTEESPKEHARPRPLLVRLETRGTKDPSDPFGRTSWAGWVYRWGEKDLLRWAEGSSAGDMKYHLFQSTEALAFWAKVAPGGVVAFPPNAPLTDPGVPVVDPARYTNLPKPTHEAPTPQHHN